MKCVNKARHFLNDSAQVKVDFLEYGSNIYCLITSFNLEILKKLWVCGIPTSLRQSS